MALIQVSEMRPGDEVFVGEMLALAMRSLPSLAQKHTPELIGMARLEMSRWQPERDRAFVAWKTGQRLGAIWLHASGEPGAWHYTLGLAVAPLFRRQGVGACLLQHALDWSRQHQGHTLSLKVHPSNEAARRLYQRFGFEEEMIEMRHKLKFSSPST